MFLLASLFCQNLNGPFLNLEFSLSWMRAWVTRWKTYLFGETAIWRKQSRLRPFAHTSSFLVLLLRDNVVWIQSQRRPRGRSLPSPWLPACAQEQTCCHIELTRCLYHIMTLPSSIRDPVVVHQHPGKTKKRESLLLLKANQAKVNHGNEILSSRRKWLQLVSFCVTFLPKSQQPQFFGTSNSVYHGCLLKVRNNTIILPLLENQSFEEENSARSQNHSKIVHSFQKSLTDNIPKKVSGEWVPADGIVEVSVWRHARVDQALWTVQSRGGFTVVFGQRALYFLFAASGISCSFFKSIFRPCLSSTRQ